MLYYHRSIGFTMGKKQLSNGLSKSILLSNGFQWTIQIYTMYLLGIITAITIHEPGNAVLTFSTNHYEVYWGLLKYKGTTGFQHRSDGLQWNGPVKWNWAILYVILGECVFLGVSGFVISGKVVLAKLPKVCFWTHHHIFDKWVMYSIHDFIPHSCSRLLII
jgi:hypothetical protein